MKALSQYMDVSIMKVVGKTSLEECKTRSKKNHKLLLEHLVVF